MLTLRVIIIGAGPAGLFAALIINSEHGVKPIIIRKRKRCSQQEEEILAILK